MTNIQEQNSAGTNDPLGHCNGHNVSETHDNVQVLAPNEKLKKKQIKETEQHTTYRVKLKNSKSWSVLEYKVK